MTNPIVVHITDSRGVYLRTEQIDAYGPQPEYASYVEPPEPEAGFTRVWIAPAWQQIPDEDIPDLPWPPGPVPEEVEGWQAEVAMKATPVDPDAPESQSVWDRVQDLIAAMPDGIEKITVQTVQARGKIRRDSPMLAQLAPLVPLSEDRVDDLMRLAASIEA